MSSGYYIGLDIGTNSVGWAVTDTSYNLLRRKGKDLWGVREFDSAQTAAETRMHRTARRRRQREVARLGLLKELFHNEITQHDPAFFVRLDESKYHAEDKRTEEKRYTLFADKNDKRGYVYTDQDYYTAYPTIFHLRKALIEDTVEHDERYSRLVYLAISNMFKHRGHFLNAGLTADNLGANLEEQFLALVERAEELEAECIDKRFACLRDIDCVRLEEILADRNLSRTQKTESLAGYLNISKKVKAVYEVLKAICGQTFKPSDIFADNKDDIFDEETIKISLCFKDDTDETMQVLAECLDAESMDFVENLKAVHDAGCLAEVMKGYPYLSYARVASYDKYHDDLQILKSLVREHCSDQYDALFREMNEGSYSAYVGSVNSKKLKARRNVKGRKRDDLYTTLKKVLKQVPDCCEKELVLADIEKGVFLPKQLSSENGIIPNQVHLAELRVILSNAEHYIPFLSEADSDGHTVTDRIIQLFRFRIPYFVGPLNKDSKRAWVVRKDIHGTLLTRLI